MEIARQNRAVNRSAGNRPLQLWQEQALSACSRMRPVPPATLLDLHLSLRCRRRVDNAHSIDFAGRNCDITANLRKSVIIVYHPRRKFRVVMSIPSRTFGLLF